MEDKKVSPALARRERIRASFKAVAKTAAGRDVLHYLMQECGFLLSDVVSDPKSGELLPLASLYNQGRRNVYVGSIRPMLDPKTASVIENEWSLNNDNV
jgi:hypothetical protein